MRKTAPSNSVLLLNLFPSLMLILHHTILIGLLRNVPLMPPIPFWQTATPSTWSYFVVLASVAYYNGTHTAVRTAAQSIFLIVLLAVHSPGYFFLRGLTTCHRRSFDAVTWRSRLSFSQCCFCALWRVATYFRGAYRYRVPEPSAILSLSSSSLRPCVSLSVR